MALFASPWGQLDFFHFGNPWNRPYGEGFFVKSVSEDGEVFFSHKLRTSHLIQMEIVIFYLLHVGALFTNIIKYLGMLLLPVGK